MQRRAELIPCAPPSGPPCGAAVPLGRREPRKVEREAGTPASEGCPPRSRASRWADTPPHSLRAADSAQHCMGVLSKIRRAARIVGTTRRTDSGLKIAGMTDDDG